MGKREVTNVWNVFLLAPILLLSARAVVGVAPFNSGLVATELWVAVAEVNWLLTSASDCHCLLK